MSWQTINEILGLAATDDEFAQQLLTNPVATVEKLGYRLSAKELEVFRLSASDTLASFSQNVLHHLSDSRFREEQP